MFTELSSRPIPGEPPRRWFTSGTMDLVVWLAPDASVQAFQLCYGKPIQERALTWRAGFGFSHLQVDDGSAPRLGHKSTPVLQAKGTPDWPALLSEFDAEKAALPPALAEFVQQRLNERASTPDEH
jgi:hypothetical protein